MEDKELFKQKLTRANEPDYIAIKQKTLLKQENQSLREENEKLRQALKAKPAEKSEVIRGPDESMRLEFDLDRAQRRIHDLEHSLLLKKREVLDLQTSASYDGNESSTIVFLNQRLSAMQHKVKSLTDENEKLASESLF